MDLKRVQPPSSVEPRENLQLSSWSRIAFVLLLLLIGWFYLFVLFLQKYFSLVQCFQYFQFFLEIYILLFWSLVVRYEKWEVGLCLRSVFFKEEVGLLSCQLLVSLSSSGLCDFSDKDGSSELDLLHELSEQVSEPICALWEHKQQMVGSIFLSICLLFMVFWGLSLSFGRRMVLSNFLASLVRGTVPQSDHFLLLSSQKPPLQMELVRLYYIQALFSALVTGGK